MHPSFHSLALLACWLPAQAALAQAPQAAAPPRRAHHSLVYDGARHRVLLSGGSTPLDSGRRFEFFNDLWAFDGTNWTSMGTSGEPMSGAALAFDGRRSRVVSFGGYRGGAGSLGELRALENDAWVSLGQHPELRAAEPGFVYDARRGRFVAFGGSAGRGQAHGDTWEYDGSTWTKAAVTGPPARQGHVMVFDQRRGVTVVFGGMGTAPAGQRPPMLGDLWEYDGTRWTQRQATGPSPRAGAGAAYDARRGLVIVFGGTSSDGFLGDTWAWDGTGWRQLTTSGPEPRAMGYLAYDARRDRVVLFGGRKGWPDGDLNDTWEFDSGAWRQAAGGP